MTRGASLLLVFVLAAGCDFDKELQYKQRQYRMQYPATLVLTNQTLQTVHVKALVSASEADNTFTITQGFSMASGATVRLGIREREYDDISAGFFILHGVCGDKEWEVAGQMLDREAVYDVGRRWDVTVAISTCDP